ncbi:LuxR C-terminal-related transcriptional regulator [Streptomyces sp. IBSNAI002]|uniref:LuxR C-terminal-related transcriptional regulator n=1 Tax=Streptomyces sp. IBSNAI002 TaxID=3457500 RepID=UPI003FD22C76
MITVLLVSSERETRLELRGFLHPGTGINTIGEAWDHATAKEQVRVLLPDVVIVHIEQRNDAFAVTRSLVKEPDAPQILLVGPPDPAHVEQAITSGASGMLTGDSLETSLVRAVRSIASGQAFFAPSLTRDVIELASRRTSPEPVTEDHPGLVALTDRQRDVLMLLAAGLSNADIAERLHLGLGTVKTHVRDILARLGAKNRVEAARIAFGRTESEG